MYPKEKAWRKLLVSEALTQQNGACQYCKEPLPRSRATADHKIPRCRYGRDTKENIVAACKSCNQAKGSLSEGQFWKLIKRDFPHGAPSSIIVVWAARRIWKRTHRASDRIMRASGTISGIGA